MGSYNSTGRRRRLIHQALYSWLLLTAALVLLPGLALAQDQKAPPESFRRIIFVPGVDFDPTVSKDEGPFNACKRAWKDEGGTFHAIAQDLQEPTHYLGFSRHIYNAQQDFLAFSYNPKWTPLGQPKLSIGLPDPFPVDTAITHVDQCDSANDYTGAETRQHVILSAYKFQAQISKWRTDCPFCRFDIICHSLGGAVVVYWAATIAHDEDLAYIHNIITIDSPINGILPFEVHFTSLNTQGSPVRDAVKPIIIGLIDSAGDAGRALQGLPTDHGPLILPAEPFLVGLKKEPIVDITCIGNDQEALILPTEATRGSCHSYQGAYSDPWWLTTNWTAGINNAHSAPLQNPAVLAAIDLALVHNDVHWIQSTAQRTEPLADRDARIHGLSTFPIVEPGATATITITMANAGVLPWIVEDDELTLVGGEPFGKLQNLRLTAPVLQDGAAIFTLTFKAPSKSGVYTNEWQMTYKGQPYGSRAFFSVVVITEEQRNPGAVVGAFVGKVWQDTLDQIAELEEKAKNQVEKLVRAEINRQIDRLLGTLCGAGPTALLLAGGVVWRRKRRARRGTNDAEP